MQFKHPELLYALFLLLIPIIIHLFQLRKFQKIDFTNVAFLKKVNIQTRKSSQLKKWLTLVLRLFALACIILAFAQPFTASRTALNTQKETVVYLDNSFSMQAKGPNGPLLQRAIQQLYAQANGTETISWFTNSQTHKDEGLQDFKAKLLDVDHTANQLRPEDVILKSGQLFSKSEGANKRLLWVSDFQGVGAFPEIPEDIKVEAVQLEPVNQNNISIDSVFVASRNSTISKLTVQVSSQGEVPISVPVSLYNGNELIAKAAVDFSERNESFVTFDIDATQTFKGKITIEDPNLTYDNSLFFSINTPKKIKVLSISGANATFLQHIFETTEFNYTAQTDTNTDYNSFTQQNFIILNEITSVPASLRTALADFVDKGGSLFVIPSKNGQLEEYNGLLSSLGAGSFGNYNEQEKKITQIVFAHPLYKDVFEKQVVNFQYPKVNSAYKFAANASSVLKFEDGTPFISQTGNVYTCVAPINSENSNFKNSPLIVPTLYNMAQQSLPLSQLYFTVGQANTFAVPVTLIQDEILTLKDSTSSFVPLQQTKATNVLITTTEEPTSAGVYEIHNKDQYLEDVSYNYGRVESNLQYADALNWDGARTYNSIEGLFDTLLEENSINSFWKWFAIFALLFLILEMLVLKFYKT
ncbi:BatA domain-containing protein [Marinirhabdus gelatinilytica]|uniref:Putative membrane protein (TIGR02226 family) n=1 Tax=Marinirhabdus gelatinilytica TaxID=1703343 RepID=A0A370QAK6_9FLAO|nr:BatA domain-containing protein [Marinirhabdus gelatinilytica]RDK85401.1 putative membrane protein (TIGR02226 family) [Marinirhabdus gelatinilytica]